MKIIAEYTSVWAEGNVSSQAILELFNNELTLLSVTPSDKGENFEHLESEMIEVSLPNGSVHTLAVDAGDLIEGQAKSLLDAISATNDDLCKMITHVVTSPLIDTDELRIDMMDVFDSYDWQPKLDLSESQLADFALFKSTGWVGDGLNEHDTLKFLSLVSATGESHMLHSVIGLREFASQNVIASVKPPLVISDDVRSQVSPHALEIMLSMGGEWEFYNVDNSLVEEDATQPVEFIMCTPNGFLFISDYDGKAIEWDVYPVSHDPDEDENQGVIMYVRVDDRGELI